MIEIDKKLRQDISRFFQVYQDRVENSLSKRLPMAEARIAKSSFAEEIPAFYESLMNRLEEEFKR